MGEDAEWDCPAIIKQLNAYMDGKFAENGYVCKGPLRKGAFLSRNSVNLGSKT